VPLAASRAALLTAREPRPPPVQPVNCPSARLHWCLYEIVHTQTADNVRFGLALAPAERAALIRALRHDRSAVEAALLSFDARRADASLAADKTMILELIAQRFGRGTQAALTTSPAPAERGGGALLHACGAAADARPGRACSLPAVCTPRSPADGGGSPLQHDARGARRSASGSALLQPAGPGPALRTPRQLMLRLRRTYEDGTPRGQPRSGQWTRRGGAGGAGAGSSAAGGDEAGEGAGGGAGVPKRAFRAARESGGADLEAGLRDTAPAVEPSDIPSEGGTGGHARGAAGGVPGVWNSDASALTDQTSGHGPNGWPSADASPPQQQPKTSQQRPPHQLQAGAPRRSGAPGLSPIALPPSTVASKRHSAGSAIDGGIGGCRSAEVLTVAVAVAAVASPAAAPAPAAPAAPASPAAPPIVLQQSNDDFSTAHLRTPPHHAHTPAVPPPTPIAAAACRAAVAAAAAAELSAVASEAMFGSARQPTQTLREVSGALEQLGLRHGVQVREGEGITTGASNAPEPTSCSPRAPALCAGMPVPAAVPEAIASFSYNRTCYLAPRLGEHLPARGS
jgi:hypothetical protein